MNAQSMKKHLVTGFILLLPLVPLFALLFSRWLASLLGGLTGDSYGAVCELSEILSLCLFTVLR